jgi:cellulose synthase/poly-beta-1,6-N-acetylglucosamine synthase-like glycosyltransferase
MPVVILWGALGALVYVYVGYPALVWLLATLRPRPVRRAPITPRTSFICTVYNEEAVIGEKLRNTLAFDYPVDQLEILIASDGSTDRTDEIVRAEQDPRVRLLRVEGRVGKTATQNEAVRAATGEILVFSDATTMYRPDAVGRIVRNFADPDVGLATGSVVYGTEVDTSVDQGRAAYWNYESFLRTQESTFHSVMGAAGCFYAMRKPLYNFLGAELISDVAQAVKTVQKGYRAVVDDSAVCYEPAESSSIPEEIRRRARVIARSLRSTWMMRDFFNPLRHPWFCLLLFSHRILRWAVPFILFVVFVANACLLDNRLYRWLFLAQLAFYGLALLGWLLERSGRKAKLLMVPFYFCVVNASPVLGVWSLLRGEKKVTWDTTRANAPARAQRQP